MLTGCQRSSKERQLLGSHRDTEKQRKVKKEKGYGRFPLVAFCSPQCLCVRVLFQRQSFARAGERRGGHGRTRDGGDGLAQVLEVAFQGTNEEQPSYRGAEHILPFCCSSLLHPLCLCVRPAVIRVSPPLDAPTSVLRPLREIPGKPLLRERPLRGGIELGALVVEPRAAKCSLGFRRKPATFATPLAELIHCLSCAHRLHLGSGCSLRFLRTASEPT